MVVDVDLLEFVACLGEDTTTKISYGSRLEIIAGYCGCEVVRPLKSMSASPEAVTATPSGVLLHFFSMTSAAGQDWFLEKNSLLYCSPIGLTNVEG